MKRYKVVYESSADGDCTSVWTKAYNEDEAIDNVRCEYWDVRKIIDCYEF